MNVRVDIEPSKKSLFLPKAHLKPQFSQARLGKKLGGTAEQNESIQKQYREKLIYNKVSQIKQKERLSNKREWSQPAPKELMKEPKVDDDPYDFEANNIDKPFAPALSALSHEGSKLNISPAIVDSPTGTHPEQTQDATKQRLFTLINSCNTLQKHTIRNLNKLEVQRQSQSQINSTIDHSIEMLKDLELIESSMIQTVFEYNKLNLEEMKATTREVVLEHRSG